MLHTAGPQVGIRWARSLHPGLSILLTAAVLLPALGHPGPSWADEPNRAALAVLFDDGTRVARCIEFEGAEITGAEMLTRSGLATVIDATHGGGITVCQIEGKGCDYPVDPCFCQCMGNGPCRYWNYYYRRPGQAEWVYSPLGALIHKSGSGSVEAWVWGDGHTPPDPGLTFESICAPAPTPTLTVVQEEQPEVPAPAGGPATEVAPLPALPPEAQRENRAPAAAAQGATRHPAPTPAAPTRVLTPAAEPGNAAQSWRSYWPFGLMLLALAALALYLRASRRL